jgi:HK97 family phage major capsid protein
MKKFLEKLIARKKQELADTEARMKKSEDLAEVRALGDMLLKLRDEITDAENQLRDLADEDNKEKEVIDDQKDVIDDQQDTIDEEDKNRRSAGNPKGGLNPLQSYGLNGNGKQGEGRSESEDPRATMEYRKAFMDYVMNGNRAEVLQVAKRAGDNSGFEMRTDAATESSDLGVLLPVTVVQEIMTGVEKVYGQLYSRVKKTNIKGGVKYPIGEFGATFKRIGENGAPTDRQKGGKITGYVEFSYKLGEVRIAQTLLANVLSVPVFEAELAKVIVEAYVKAMDDEILNGDPAENQMEGILTELNKETGSRIPENRIIDFTDEEMKDWKTWQKKLFAVIPLGMRNEKPEFLMTANTYEANIKTLHDDNNRPLYFETFNPIDGAERATFKAREVVFIEEGQGIENFNDAEDGEVFGFYWVPERAYAINTNLEFAVKRYFDEEKLQYVERAVVINDGKLLNPDYIWILRKKVSA